VITEVYRKLGGLLAKEHEISAKNLGDNGRFAPLLTSMFETLVDKIAESSENHPGKWPFDGEPESGRGP
jgi:enolase